MIDDQKSLFQVTKVLKVNLLKHSKISKVLTIPLKFGLGSLVRLHGFSNQHRKIRHCGFHTPHLKRTKLPNPNYKGIVRSVLFVLYVYFQCFVDLKTRILDMII